MVYEAIYRRCRMGGCRQLGNRPTPGTGDAHLSLIQTVPLNGGIIVTTLKILFCSTLKEEYKCLKVKRIRCC